MKIKLHIKKKWKLGIKVKIWGTKRLWPIQKEVLWCINISVPVLFFQHKRVELDVYISINLSQYIYMYTYQPTMAITMPMSMAIEENDSNVEYPPGFRFYPTEEELISFYLRHQLNGQLLEKHRVIPLLNIYDSEPWDLPSNYSLSPLLS